MMQGSEARAWQALVHNVNGGGVDTNRMRAYARATASNFEFSCDADRSYVDSRVICGADVAPHAHIGGRVFAADRRASFPPMIYENHNVGDQSDKMRVCPRELA